MVRRETRSLGQFGRRLFPLLALCFFWVGAALAADNAECLKCHQNPKLSKGKKDGSLLSLHVDEKAFEASAHGEAGMGCTDCHEEARPDFHPAEGFPEVGCAGCHEDEDKAYKQTAHGMMLGSGMEGSPNCQDCHTSHYMRKITDPQSPVNASRLPEACAKCHEEARSPKGFFMALATYRILGHPKVSLEYEFDTQVCANCHPEEAGHPEKNEPTSFCVKCHDPSDSKPLLLGPIHFKVSFWEQPVPFLLRFLYGAGLILVVLACAGFFGYRTYAKKKARKVEGEKPAEGPGTAS